MKHFLSILGYLCLCSTCFLLVGCGDEDDGAEKFGSGIAFHDPRVPDAQRPSMDQGTGRLGPPEPPAGDYPKWDYPPSAPDGNAGPGFHPGTGIAGSPAPGKGGFFNRSTEEEMINRVPGLLGGILGEKSNGDTGEAAGSILDDITSHPLGAYAPEILGALISGEKIVIDPEVKDAISENVPFMVEGLLEEVEKENPTAAAIGGFILREVLEKQNSPTR